MPVSRSSTTNAHGNFHVGPGGCGSRLGRGGGCTISVPWIYDIEVSLLCSRRLDTTWIGLPLDPFLARCHAAQSPQTLCYLVMLLTEVTPYWMFCPARGPGPRWLAVQMFRPFLQRLIRTHARLRSCPAQGQCAYFSVGFPRYFCIRNGGQYSSSSGAR